MMENFIHIENETVQDAVKVGLIVKIGENYMHNGNIYYLVNEMKNTVLMRVKVNKYIIIDEYIDYNGLEVKLVPILSKLSFNVSKTKNKENNSRERVKAGIKIEGKRTTGFIERLVRSITINGQISSLPKDMQVHHVHETYNNKIDSTDYLWEGLHLDRKSHIQGISIASITEFNCKIQSKRVYRENNYATIAQ